MSWIRDFAGALEAFGEGLRDYISKSLNDALRRWKRRLQATIKAARQIEDQAIEWLWELVYLGYIVTATLIPFVIGVAICALLAICFQQPLWYLLALAWVVLLLVIGFSHMRSTDREGVDEVAPDWFRISCKAVGRLMAIFVVFGLGYLGWLRYDEIRRMETQEEIDFNTAREARDAWLRARPKPPAPLNGEEQIEKEETPPPPNVESKPEEVDPPIPAGRKSHHADPHKESEARVTKPVETEASLIADDQGALLPLEELDRRPPRTPNLHKKGSEQIDRAEDSPVSSEPSPDLPWPNPAPAPIPPPDSTAQSLRLGRGTNYFLYNIYTDNESVAVDLIHGALVHAFNSFNINNMHGIRILRRNDKTPGRSQYKAAQKMLLRQEARKEARGAKNLDSFLGPYDGFYIVVYRRIESDLNIYFYAKGGTTIVFRKDCEWNQCLSQIRYSLPEFLLQTVKPK